MEQYVYCRVCHLGHSLVVQENADGEVVLKADPKDPFSFGRICTACQYSQQARTSPARFGKPKKRVGNSWTEVSWDNALKEIAEQLAQEDSDQLGVYIGEHAMRRSADFIRAMNFSVAHGVGHIFSTLCLHSGPKRLGAEWSMGFAAELLSDLGRAHNIIMLGCDPSTAGWGQEGTLYEALIEHSRKTKNTKVSCLSPSQGQFSKKMDRQLPIRPGTEPFLMLGMVQNIIKSGWGDQQYIDDYTIELEKIKPLIQAWDVQRCADICGIKVSDLSGISLKFSRAAMGIVHPGVGTFHNENSALAAWAWMAVHMVTANALRPGGMYENLGGFDLYPFLSTLNRKNAPTSPATNKKLQLMQTPASAIPESGVRSLVCLGDIPPALRRTSLQKALSQMKLVIACAQHPNWLTEQAHWILPTTHPLEEADTLFHLNPSLPCKALPKSAAIYEPHQESKPIDCILKELSGLLKTSWKGPWGYHVKGASRIILKADLNSWLERILDLGSTDLSTEPGYRFQGESDRSLWRPEGNYLRFFNDELSEIFKHIKPPETSSTYPFLLHCSGRIDDAPNNAHRSKPLAPFVAVHPNTGIAEGQVTLQTEYGSLQVVVRHDEGVREDVVRAPVERVPEVMSILPDRFAEWTGAPILDGVACQIR